MKSYKFFACFIALVFALTPIAYAANSRSEVINGILAYICGETEQQEWLDTVLSENAGGSLDNLLPGLLRMHGNYDFSAYIKSLDEKMDGGIKSVTSRQRSALILSILGESERVPEGFADETIGKLGVMSYVFGLHLLNNGFESQQWTADSLLDKLISLQLQDGGWAVTGQSSDPDVTAMCIQALAGCPEEIPGKKAVLESALNFLSNVQQPDGGYRSYGKPACESSAQVLIALNSLGIDPLSDARFIKNGHSALDAMMSFRLEDGSFSHTDDGKASTMACIQALNALLSMERPGVPYYVFSDSPAAPVSSFPRWKLAAFSVIALLTLIGCIAGLIRRGAKVKRFLTALLLGIIAAAAVFAANIESTESYYTQAETDRKPDGQVWLSIRCDTVAGRADDGSTPEDGEILARTAVDFYEGDSVFDVLTHAARKYEIHLEHEGAANDLVYINGINYLYEYAYGDLSGWLYFLNGEELSIGCGNCPVSDGDEIVWRYSLSMGKDL